jgi:DNA polymerase-1
MMYGLSYGAGTAKMAETAGVPVDQMKVVVDAVNARYPGIKQFMKKVEHEGVLREKQTGQGYIVTPYGRRLPCDEEKMYTLVNYLLQGTASEVFKHAIVDLDAAGWSEAMVLPIHDEVLLDVPAEDAEQALHDVPKIMTNHDFALELGADSDGPYDRWGARYR